MFYRLAHPTRLLKLMLRIRPWAGYLTCLLFGVGLWLSLIASPQDYQHKDTVRIMYVHVPASWFALFIYLTMAICHAVGHIWKHPMADLMAKSIAPVGLVLTILSLITGSLWGKPMWGTWWVWDARLTSMFVLALLYASYVIAVQAYDDLYHGLNVGRIISLIGVINLPIIKWSVNWWHTLHQPASLTRMAQPALHTQFLWPLMTMAGGYLCCVIWVSIVRIEREILQQKMRTLSMHYA